MIETTKKWMTKLILGAHVPLRLFVVFGMLLGMLGALTPTALADEVWADGDGVAPIASSTLDFGNVCPGTTVTKKVLVAINRQSNGANVFANSSTATVAVTGVAGNGLTATGGGSIQIPSGWDAVSTKTNTPAVSSDVQLIAGTATGTFNGSVAYQARGTNSDKKSITRDVTMAVTATISSANCDTTPPALNLPTPITAEATGATGAAVNFTVSASDANPANPVVTCSATSGSTFALGETTVTCTATDAAGNTATGSFTITVQDKTAPVISGGPANMTVEATNGGGTVVTYTAPSAADLVDGNRPVSCIPASGSTFPLGPNTVSCTSSDKAGNTATSTFTITITDTTRPVLSLPQNMTVEATGPDGAAVPYTASASDLVDGSRPVSCTPASGSTFPLGTTTVSCSASDAAGNTATDSFTVTVQDRTAPTLTLPAPAPAEATSTSGAAVSYTASAKDLVDGTIAPVCSVASGSTFALGTTTVTCTASDKAGNTVSGSFDVVVQDTTAPTLSLPTDQLLEAISPGGAPATYNASAKDVVDATPVVSCDVPSGSTFALGTTTVTCTASDKAGNKSTGVFTITVRDTTAPTLNVPADTIAEATGPSGAKVSYTASAKDVVDATPVVSCDVPSGSTFALGETTVTCTASDKAGNTSAAKTFTVTVQDTTAPAIAGAPADMTVEAMGPSGATVTYTAPTATDLVDGSRPVSCTPASGSTFPLGTTTVNCTASDNRGNTATGKFTVEIKDTTGPVLSLPQNMTVEAAGSDGAAVSYTTSATDLVDGSRPVACAPISNTTFALGTTSVSCTASDKANNTATGSFTVTVQDTKAPTLSLTNTIVEATGPGGATVTYAATAQDLVSGTIAPVCSVASGSTFALGTTSVTCTATDKAGNTATGSFTVTVQDTKAPTLNLPSDIVVKATSPAGATVTYAATATDAVDPAPSITCLLASGGTVTSGTAFAPGTTQVTCTAKDAAGNASEPKSFKVTVNYDARGFYRPVDMSTATSTVWNTVKNGSTVPLKFELFAGTTELTDTTLVSFNAAKINCTTGTEMAVEIVTTGTTSLRYDTTAGQFVYNWKTPATVSCYSVTMTAKDGSTLTAFFKLK